MAGRHASQPPRRKPANAATGTLTGLAASLCILAGSPADAQESERDGMIERAAHACPASWTNLPVEFLGGEVTVDDPWVGPAGDRDDFIAYLAVEMAEDQLTAAELSRLADDPMVVIAECSHQKLRLARYLAAVDAEVAISTADPGEDGGDGDFPNGLTQADAATSCGAILAAWPESPNAEYWLDADGGDTANAEQTFCLMVPYPDGTTAGAAELSCDEIKTHFPASDNGVYWLDVNAGDPADAFTAWCDMTTAGGGWTLVAAQFEADQLTEWNEGIQADYDPTLAAGKSFTLDNNELPAHAETAFGKSLDPTFVDYADFVYTPFDIQKTLLVGKKTGKQYHVHRDIDGFGYRNGDPEDNIGSATGKIGQVTFDETGGTLRTWSYSPNRSWSVYRGTSMLGNRNDLSDEYAWTIWVR